MKCKIIGVLICFLGLVEVGCVDSVGSVSTVEVEKTSTFNFELDPDKIDGLKRGEPTPRDGTASRSKKVDLEEKLKEEGISASDVRDVKIKSIKFRLRTPDALTAQDDSSVFGLSVFVDKTRISENFSVSLGDLNGDNQIPLSVQNKEYLEKKMENLATIELKENIHYPEGTTIHKKAVFEVKLQSKIKGDLL